MITLTKPAAEEILRVIKEQNIPGDAALRLGVSDEGCSSHAHSKSYFIQLEEVAKSVSDQLFESEGVRILVDQKSLPYLSGLQLDFVDSLEGRGFVFSNPNAKKQCGCGHSFSVEEE